MCARSPGLIPGADKFDSGSHLSGAGMEYVILAKICKTSKNKENIRFFYIYPIFSIFINWSSFIVYVNRTILYLFKPVVSH